MSSNGVVKEPLSLCYLCILEQTPIEFQGRSLRINCTKCHRAYCEKHAAILDVTYCQPCLSDFSVTRQDYIRAGVAITHVMDANGNVVKKENGEPETERRYYSTKSKQIILFGNDWLFAEIKMSEMTEAQCETALEWHKAHVSYLEAVITQHRVAKAHKLAQVRIPVAQRIATRVKEKKEKSLQALAESMAGSMSQADMLKLLAKLQASVGGGKK